MNEKIKTAADLVREANELARLFSESMRYEVEVGYRFDKARHPQEQGMWNLAVMAYDHIEGTDIEDALAELEEQEEERNVMETPIYLEGEEEK